MSTDKTSRPLWSLGVLLVFGGVIAYVVQIAVLRRLTLPWYLPIVTTAGMTAVAWDVFRRRSFARCVGAAVCLLLTAMSWAIVVSSEFKLPEMTTKSATGTAIPAFAARLSDGTPFTEANLANGRRSVLVFFRGHW